MRFSLARCQLALGQVAGGDVGDLLDRDRERLGEVVLARADVDPDLAGVGVLRERSCRPSRPARASRGSPGRAATRPSRRGSRRGSTRRSGGGRSARCRARRGRRGTARCPCAGSAGPGCGALHERRPDARPRRRPARRARSSARCDELDELVVVDAAGRRDDDVARRVAGAVVAARARRGRRVEITSAVPITGRPSAMVAEDRLADQVVDELLRRVLVHRDLLEHDLALGVEVVEERREDHVAHHVERRLDVAVGDARVDDRVLARGRGVQLAAEPVEDLGDLERAVAARALEEQVLDEVRDARPSRRSRRASRRRSSSRSRPSGRAASRSEMTRSPESSSRLDPVLHGTDRRRGSIAWCRSRPARSTNTLVAGEDRREGRRASARPRPAEIPPRIAVSSGCGSDRDRRQDADADGARQDRRPERAGAGNRGPRPPGTEHGSRCPVEEAASADLDRRETCSRARRSRTRARPRSAPAPATDRGDQPGDAEAGADRDRHGRARAASWTGASLWVGRQQRPDQVASCRRPWSQIDRRSRPSSWKPQRSATRCDGPFSGCVRISIRPTPASKSQRQTSLHRPRDEAAVRGRSRVRGRRAPSCRDGRLEAMTAPSTRCRARVGDREVAARPGRPAVAHRPEQLVEVPVSDGASGMFSQRRTSGSTIVSRTAARSLARRLPQRDHTVGERRARQADLEQVSRSAR